MFVHLRYNPACMGYQSRNYHENNFHFIINYNQEYFQNFCFIRSAKLWKNLPTEMRTSNILCSFNTRLNNLDRSEHGTNMKFLSISTGGWWGYVFNESASGKQLSNVFEITVAIE